MKFFCRSDCTISMYRSLVRQLGYAPRSHYRASQFIYTACWGSSSIPNCRKSTVTYTFTIEKNTTWPPTRCIYILLKKTKSPSMKPKIEASLFVIWLVVDLNFKNQNTQNLIGCLFKILLKSARVKYIYVTSFYFSYYWSYKNYF